ncbi:Rib/alpha-like domain-containing protein, partial [Arcanobacterium phocae]
MITKKLQQVWAFVLALVLMLVALSGGLLTTRFAHAEENAQAQSVTVNFDFDSLAGKGNFADHVWVYQWENSGNYSSLPQRISKDTKFVTLKPLGNEKVANFIVYIGDFARSGVLVWNRWDEGAEAPAKTANITATPGSFYNVTYDNLRKDAQHRPQPAKMAEIYAPYFPGETTVSRGKKISLNPPIFTDVHGDPKTPSGSLKYAVTGDETLHAKITPGGILSVTPGYDATLGQNPVQVTVTYADNSSDTVPVIFTITKASLMDLTYTPNSVAVKQGETAALSLSATLDGIPAVVPANTKYASTPPLHSAIKIDPFTGDLTVAPASDAQLGEYDVTVMATLNDQKIAEGKAHISIIAKESSDLSSQLWDITYEKTTIEQRETKKIELTSTLFGKKRALPADVTFAKTNTMPSWVMVDSNTGTITANPDEYVAAQDYEFTVAVTHLDGKVTTVPVKITVTKTDNAPELKSQLWKLSYADTTVQQLKTASVDLTATLFGKERALPRAVTFAKGTDMPSWVTVDPKTGKVTANPDEYAAAQDYEFTVAVTHLDGKVTTVPVKITITKADNAPELKSQLWKLSYADTAVQQLKTASVDLTATLFGKERALPRAVTFAKGTDMPSWVTVDP